MEKRYTELKFSALAGQIRHKAGNKGIYCPTTSTLIPEVVFRGGVAARGPETVAAGFRKPFRHHICLCHVAVFVRSLLCSRQIPRPNELAALFCRKILKLVSISRS